jgi:hypothetical protein
LPSSAGPRTGALRPLSDTERSVVFYDLTTLRIHKALIEAKLPRFIQPDLQAERFSFSINQTALAKAEVLDGTLVLLTSVRDLDA